MNTTVFNLLTLAATEYDTVCTGVAGDYEASAAGVHKLVESCDPAPLQVGFGMVLQASERRQRPKYLYVFGDGLADLSATISDTRENAYEYAVQQLHDRAARFVLGAGIRDNYIQLTLSRASVEPMLLDRLELVTVASGTRRL